MFNILQKYNGIIKNIEIKAYEFDENQLRIKVVLRLSDKSKLIIKDYKFSNNKRKYAYHWMDSQGKLKIRWDNAPHWEAISTFPHHKHVGSTENLLHSTETDIDSVLNYIEKIILA
ncbi:MAG: hypothetical protein KAT34_03035 [Candidatus Aminicenantes bacterium]|nr:hypothetical protein [Candidatus Aminicenantes bacterium]